MSFLTCIIFEWLGGSAPAPVILPPSPTPTSTCVCPAVRRMHADAPAKLAADMVDDKWSFADDIISDFIKQAFPPTPQSEFKNLALQIYLHLYLYNKYKM